MSEQDNSNEYALPYEISSSCKTLPMRDCYVNLETEPSKPMRLVYGTVYPAYPYKLRSTDDDHIRDNPAKTWEVLRSFGAVPDPVPAKLPRGYE